MQTLYDLAMQMINVPYIWGGRCPIDGVDCSSLVTILLHSVGLDIGIASSQDLFDHFSKVENHRSNELGLGALLFYGASPSNIHHVAMGLSATQMVEAGGGGHLVTTRELAIKYGAYVKVVPTYTKGLQGVYTPHYPETP